MSDDHQDQHEVQTREGDVAFIQALAEMLNRNDLAEITVKREYGENDRLTLSLSRHGKQVMVQAAAPTGHVSPAPMPTPAAENPGPAAAPDPVADPADLPGVVPSPMVGTVYLAPEPGAASFVSVGEQVTEGQTLLIVEAMKTMNHIPAPHSGTVRRVLVEDGAPVEFGSPLMIVE